jgi:uncharacterized protein YegJ (DUF2314 family)
MATRTIWAVIPFLYALFFFSCEKFSLPYAGQGHESAAMYVDQSNSEINKITENAQNTQAVFFLLLATPAPGEQDFCLKYPFLAEEGSGIFMEHIWLTGIYFKNGSYYGILSASPLYLHELKKGDTVSFNTDLITDWMYTRNGKIIGGYSIKYLLENIPEGQRSEEQQKILDMF